MITGVFDCLFEIGGQLLQAAFVAQIVVGEQFIELALAALGRAALQVAFPLFVTAQFAIGRELESLGCAFIGFDLGHFYNS
jgi:hypothetical protein